MAVKSFAIISFLTTLVFSFDEVKCIIPPNLVIESEEASFMVFVQNERHNCGGVILSKDIVLTAAHCVNEPKFMQVSAGQSNTSSNVNKQIVGVERTLRHENYSLDPNGIQAYYDIGLLLLKSPLTFNKHVQPINWTNNIDFGSPVTVLGWGSTNAFQKTSSMNLRAKNVSLIADELCIDMLNKTITKCTKQIYDVCAEKSACYGDSGGGMTQKVQNVTKLVGITAWLADDNINCNTTPAVFVNVGFFSDWIAEGIANGLKHEDDDANIVQKY